MDNRDAFEKRLGEQLRQASAPVPGTLWAQIRNGISGAAQGSGVSQGAWWIGGLAAVAMLGSLAWYGAIRPMDAPSGAAPHIVVSEPLRTNADGVSGTSERGISAENMADALEQPSSVSAHAPAATVTAESEVGNSTPSTTSSSVEDARIEETALTSDRNAETEPTSPSPQSSATQTDDVNELPVRVSHPSVLVDADETESEQNTSTVDDPSKSFEETKSSEPLDFRILTDKTKGYAPFTVDLRAAGNAESYYWDLGRAGTVDGEKARVTFEEPGTYTVYLVGTNNSGDTRSKPVTFVVEEGSNLVVPDSFSPNGDGINDTYGASGVGIKSYRLTILDSKGRVVFETRNLKDVWDAQADNHPHSGEFYRVVVQAVGVDGKRYNVTKPLNIIQ